jgi:cysteine desulfurase
MSIRTDGMREAYSRGVTTFRDPDAKAASIATDRPIYLDCNATTPVDPEVRTEVLRYLDEEFGNAGSRTHSYGQAAKNRVNQARSEVASVVDAQAEEVFFTSGATESNNLALLGLLAHGSDIGRRHIVSTQIEHKAVLEPLDHARSLGFDVTLLPPTVGGWVDPAAIARALRGDTLLVSIMSANNETGVIQPIEEIAMQLADHHAFLHVYAAQSFGKLPDQLRSRRIDLLSVSGHKLYAPKGVGALIARRRGFTRPPLKPLAYGGGQERGLRPGTLPVHLIAGLGAAAAIAIRDHAGRRKYCLTMKRELVEAFEDLGVVVNGDPDRTLPHTINISMPGIDSEAAMVALKELVAISNGSACTSQNYEPSHVLAAMGCAPQTVQSAMRLSWSHLTPQVGWKDVTYRLSNLR